MNIVSYALEHRIQALCLNYVYSQQLSTLVQYNKLPLLYVRMGGRVEVDFRSNLGEASGNSQ